MKNVKISKLAIFVYVKAINDIEKMPRKHILFLIDLSNLPKVIFRGGRGSI